MGKAILAIVGRPNVGKSTLFNTLAGEKISIVEDHPGVTRDRIYADVTWLNHSFSMIDTGGIEMDSKDKMLKHMREQADIAIARLVPGVLNNEESAETESFSDGLLEYPQYTRPVEILGRRVPDVLMSGHHEKINEWRKEQSIMRTRERRPDLYKSWLENNSDT